jgi:hypothetical protein
MPGTTVASSTKLAAKLDMRIADGEDGCGLARAGGQKGERRGGKDEAEAPIECRRFFNVPHQMPDMMEAADERSRSFRCSECHG